MNDPDMILRVETGHNIIPGRIIVVYCGISHRVRTAVLLLLLLTAGRWAP